MALDHAMDAKIFFGAYMKEVCNFGLAVFVLLEEKMEHLLVIY